MFQIQHNNSLTKQTLHNHNLLKNSNTFLMKKIFIINITLIVIIYNDYKIKTYFFIYT